MLYVYVPYTIEACKDGVCLFQADCEIKISYDLPDGRGGMIDWDVSEFHFDAVGTEPGKRIYTKIAPHEPLFKVLYAALEPDRDQLGVTLREVLADHGDVDLYEDNRT